MRQRFLRRLLVAFCLGAVLMGGASAGKLPWRQAGLWEVTLRDEGASVLQAQRVKQCTADEAEPDVLLAVVAGQEHCSIRSRLGTDGSLRIESLCKVHGHANQTTMQIHGDRITKYHGAWVTHWKDKFQPPIRREFTARWLGGCPTGMQVGEMVLPNGVTVDVLRDKRAHETAHDD